MLSQISDKTMLLLEYCRMGWNLFPLLPKSKLPATEHGFKDATNNIGKILEWHSINPNFNWALVTGRIVVVDIDPKNGGNTSLLHFPNTLAVRTGSGGFHLYYKNSGLDIRNSASKLAQGVDIRGQGGYVVIPPSIHPNGTSYKWWNDSEIKEFPRELRPKLEASNGQPFYQPDLITNGMRNETLFKLSCSLRTKGLHNESILAAVLIENRKRCEPPLDDDEVERIVASSLKYERRV